jgi:anti-anti-sigma regulatory factor
MVDGPSIEHGAQPGWIVVSGCLDWASKDALLEHLNAQQDLHIDLHSVRLIDASIVALLLARQRAARAAGGDLRVVGANGLPRRVLDITGAADLLVADEAKVADDAGALQSPAARSKNMRRAFYSLRRKASSVSQLFMSGSSRGSVK